MVALSKKIFENISSVSEKKLDSMYQRFQEKYPDAGQNKFVYALYKAQKITEDEYNQFKSPKPSKSEGIEPPRPQDDNPQQRDQQAQPDIIPSFKAYSHLFEIKDGEAHTIESSIDRGAMGEIFVAIDRKLGRTVAYKKMHPIMMANKDYVGRFIMEAQITAILEHPNIVPIYALETRQDNIAYSMELIHGSTLKELLNETRDQYDKHKSPDEQHTLRARLDHFLKVCDAIHYAHGKGVLHRDLKPENIMIGKYNEVYVMDWGIAKLIKVDKTVLYSEEKIQTTTHFVETHAQQPEFEKTKIGQVLGTLSYMSPEQASGEIDQLTHLSDLYSLGLILFEIVTLYKALSGKNKQDIHMKAITGDIRQPPRYKKQRYDQEQLFAIIKKATMYNASDRYQTVREFSDDIRRFIRNEPISVLPEKMQYKVIHWVVGHKAAAMNIFITILVLSVTMVVTLAYLYIKTIHNILQVG